MWFTAMRSEQSYKLMFWAPSMYQFINVSQHWSIAEILQIFVPSGDELEVPVLKFLLSKQEKMDENEGKIFAGRVSLSKVMVNNREFSFRQPRKRLLNATSRNSKVRKFGRFQIYNSLP